MKCVSWNAWIHNPDQISQYLRLIQNEQPDVVCIQEARQTLVDYLNATQGWFVETAIDGRSEKNGEDPVYYLVTVSKYPFEDVFKGGVSHLTQRSIWDRVNKWHETEEILKTVVNVGGNDYEIFNLHLEMACGPLMRLQQFRQALSHITKERLIIAGDFNIYAFPLFNILLGWLFGHSLLELFVNERRLFEKEYADIGVINNHAGSITMPLYRVQLDHILTSNNLKTTVNYVLDDTYGSDHRPVVTKIDVE